MHAVAENYKPAMLTMTDPVRPTDQERPIRSGPGYTQLSDLQTRLVQAVTGYRDYLGTGVRCEHTDYRPFDDPQFGRGYSPFRRVKCLRFDGADSVGHLRRLRKRARDAVKAGYADPTLRHAIDALVGTTALLSVQPDETVNRVNMMYTRKRAGTKLRPWCEYVRAEFVGVLNGMLTRLLGSVDDELSGGGQGGAGAKVAVVTPLVDKATLATAFLLSDPGISPTDLAAKVGVSRGTLYSPAKKWKPVRETLRARDSARALKGTKSREGTIEAEAEHREFHPTDD